MTDFPYRKLPGVRRGILSGSSLWLGSDHILHVKNTRFTEEYRRYYLNDIQAIYLEKKARFLPPPLVVIGVIIGLVAQIFFAFARRHFALEVGWFVLLALIAYAAWLCMFRSCSCFIQTALGREPLSCLHRVDSARAAIEEIANQVIQVQGPAQGHGQMPPEHVELPEPVSLPRRKEHLFAWLALAFAVIGAAIVMSLPVPIPDRLFGAALGAILVEVVFAVLALIAGRGGSVRPVQGALLSLILVSGLELYAMTLVNTYSHSAYIPANTTSQTFSMLTALMHTGSVWLARAEIAVASLSAVLLLRSSQRSTT